MAKAFKEMIQPGHRENSSSKLIYDVLIAAQLTLPLIFAVDFFIRHL